jgi:RNA polymerase sigma-70 factor (ECF subfamily)
MTIADEGLSAFMRVRPRLFGIAYRMLRSAVEAEDVVQDVWVRWQTADRRLVRDAAAFLATTATRLTINVMQSARSRRETYVGPWLPEPVDTSADPRLEAERGQALAFGVLLLLEKLTPPNEPPTSFGRRSTIHIATSRMSFGSKRPTRGKW